MNTILDTITPDAVSSVPFPHIAREGVLTDAEIERLINEYPSMDVIAEGEPLGDNKRFSYSAPKVMENSHISDMRKSFIKAHVSEYFFQQVCTLFKPYILSTYPDFEERFGELEGMRVGVRNQDTFESKDILLDAQICVNTPIREKSSSVKIAHLDNTNKLFAGLFYLRPSDDDTPGGDLELYTYNNKKPQFHGARLIRDTYVTHSATIPYKANALVLFINSFNALHGVTPRAITSRPRCFMNIIGEVSAPLFSLDAYQERKQNRFLKWLGQ